MAALLLSAQSLCFSSKNADSPVPEELGLAKALQNAFATGRQAKALK
jgi:hypothetical protein